VHVIIGTDGSDHAIEAARQALTLLAPPDILTVVCAIEPPVLATTGLESGFTGGMAAPGEIDEAWAALTQEATTTIERTLAAIPTGAATVEQRIEQGEAGWALCQVAEHSGGDVIVVGSRGHGAIRRAILGSVSSFVVNNAPCPVLVCREAADT